MIKSCSRLHKTAIFSPRNLKWDTVSESSSITRRNCYKIYVCTNLFNKIYKIGIIIDRSFNVSHLNFSPHTHTHTPIVDRIKKLYEIVVLVTVLTPVKSWRKPEDEHACYLSKDPLFVRGSSERSTIGIIRWKRPGPSEIKCRATV